MRKLIILILFVGCLSSGCIAEHNDISTASEYKAEKQSGEQKIMPPTEEQTVDVTRLNSQQKLDLAQELNSKVNNMLTDRQLQTRVFIEDAGNELQILAKDTGLTKETFLLINDALEYLQRQIGTQTFTIISCCDDKKYEAWEKENEDYWKLEEATKFTIDSRALPKSISTGQAMYADYARKEKLFETLGDLVTASDTEVVTDIKGILAPTAKYIIIRASLIEDNVVFAMNYRDLEDESIFSYLELARKRHSEAIGKEAGIQIYYYANDDWEAKKLEVNGMPMCRLTRAMIKSNVTITVQAGQENIIEALKTAHRKVNTAAVVDS